MRQQILGIGVVGISLFLGGCGGEPVLPSQPVAALPTAAFAITTSDTDLPETSTASEIVSRFMTAILHGESRTIRTLLTPLARQKSKELGISFTPQTSHTASFTIDQIIPHGENCVYVHTTLTDSNEKGEKETAEIVWIVDKNEEGWRISGAAAELFDGQDKTLLNFEDPEAAQNAIYTAEIQSVTKSTVNHTNHSQSH
ncbi:MAG: hypothetical protein LBC20_07405 [Planctomycetaceae bacterium]|jgi:hypothetical protein|nr:hypothetical protein [Planctomycetaceae bacterium]